MISHRYILWWVLTVILMLIPSGLLINTPGLKAQAAPKLTLISPADGANVDGPVVVRVEHSGIVFDGVKIGSAPEPGVGHWHINVDGKYAGLSVSNVIEIPNDTIPTISAGEHTITVDLHQNNHAATDPPVSQTIKLNFSKDVTIAPATSGAPMIKLVESGGDATGEAPIVVRIEHSGIVFDGVKIGTAPEPGVGHWHINVDGKYAGLSVSNVVEIPNDAMPTISAGEHTITVDLHQNNHAATDPPVAESFNINLRKELSVGGAQSGAARATEGTAAQGTTPVAEAPAQQAAQGTTPVAEAPAQQAAQGTTPVAEAPAQQAAQGTTAVAVEGTRSSLPPTGRDNIKWRLTLLDILTIMLVGFWLVYLSGWRPKWSRSDD